MGAKKNAIASDLAKVDSYENTAADYDEIPEITDEDFTRAIRHKGGVPVHGSAPSGERPKQSITLKLDPEIIEHYRALGPDWQSQINKALAHAIDRAGQASTKPKRA